jgi:hypothetical protein
MIIALNSDTKLLELLPRDTLPCELGNKKFDWVFMVADMTPPFPAVRDGLMKDLRERTTGQMTSDRNDFVVLHHGQIDYC